MASSPSGPESGAGSGSGSQFGLFGPVHGIEPPCVVLSVRRSAVTSDRIFNKGLTPESVWHPQHCGLMGLNSTLPTGE